MLIFFQFFLSYSSADGYCPPSHFIRARSSSFFILRLRSSPFLPRRYSFLLQMSFQKPRQAQRAARRYCLMPRQRPAADAFAAAFRHARCPPPPAAIPYHFLLPLLSAVLLCADITPFFGQRRRCHWLIFAALDSRDAIRRCSASFLMLRQFEMPLLAIVSPIISRRLMRVFAARLPAARRRAPMLDIFQAPSAGVFTASFFRAFDFFSPRIDAAFQAFHCRRRRRR